MKILIANQHTCNYGDDAAGVALLQQLSETFPEAKVDIVYNNHAVVEDECAIPFHRENVSHRSDVSISNGFRKEILKYLANRIFGIPVSLKDGFERYVKVVREADFVLVSPCGANIGIYRDWQFLARVLIPVLENKPVFFHLNTLQKSGRFVFDVVSKFVLSRSRVYVREFRSYSSLREWGIPAVYGVDTAFSLETQKVVEKGSRDPYVAFIPTDLKWHPNFKGADSISFVEDVIRSVSRYAKDNGLKVCLVPHLYGKMDEAEFLVRIRSELISAGLDSNDVYIDESVTSVFKYGETIANSSLVVSMRYHGVVFAVKECVPFVSLSYENKMKEVCTYAGVRELHVDLSAFKLERFEECLAYVTEHSKDLIDRLRSRAGYLKRRSRIVVDEIKLLESSR